MNALKHGERSVVIAGFRKLMRATIKQLMIAAKTGEIGLSP